MGELDGVALWPFGLEATPFECKCLVPPARTVAKLGKEEREDT